MKKTVLLFAALFFLSFSTEIFAQCVPVPGNTALITPDTTVNFMNGTVGVSYNQEVFIHPPTDTVTMVGSLTVTVHIDSITLVNFSNLPPGLSLTCNPSSCTFLGGISGCLNISGIPTTAGYYPVDAIIISYGSIFGGTVPVTQQDTIEAYHITIGPNGLNELTAQTFNISEVSSNPAKTDLAFNIRSGFSATVNCRILDVLGNEVIKKQVTVIPGDNKVNFILKNFASGVYLANFQTGKNSVTKRFVVSGR